MGEHEGAPLGIINITARNRDHRLGLQKRGRPATSLAQVSRARCSGAGREPEMPRGNAAVPWTGSFPAGFCLLAWLGWCFLLFANEAYVFAAWELTERYQGPRSSADNHTTAVCCVLISVAHPVLTHANASVGQLFLHGDF